jgi:20S proteasome alpha/beta subunit
MDGYGPQSQSLPSQAQDNIPWVPGATTVGVAVKDGVILASEKRVSYGYFISSKGGKKVFKITPEIGVACAGLVSDMQVLAHAMWQLTLTCYSNAVVRQKN